MGRSGRLAIVVLLIAFMLSPSFVIVNTHSGINAQNSISGTYDAPPASSQYYKATFSESGLTDQNWSVTLSGVKVSTNNDSVSFYVQSGNYSYLIGGPSGYAPSIKNGTLTVTNQSVNIKIKFTRISLFTFYETGLPAGDQWTVVMNGTHYSTKNTSITISLPYGYYNFSIILPIFYSSSPAAGTIGPGNDTVALNIVHLPTEYIIIIAVLVVVDAAIVLALMRRRRRKN